MLLYWVGGFWFHVRNNKRKSVGVMPFSLAWSKHFWCLTDLLRSPWLPLLFYSGVFPRSNCKCPHQSRSSYKVSRRRFHQERFRGKGVFCVCNLGLVFQADPSRSSSCARFCPLSSSKLLHCPQVGKDKGGRSPWKTALLPFPVL